jgi:hypothetical protein
MKDYKLKQRNLRASHTLGWSFQPQIVVYYDLGSKKRKGLKKMKMNGGPLQTKERALFFKTTSDLALQQISSSRCSSPSWYGVRRGACVSVLLPFRLHVAIVYLNAQHVVLRFLHASARGYISIIGGWEVKED